MSNDPKNGSSEMSPDDWAAFYLVGAMTSEERGEFESQLDGDQGLRDALRSLDDVSDALLEQIEPVQPAPGIREALLARVDAYSVDQPAPVIRRASQHDGWQETGVPGVTVRILFADHQQNRMTALMRLEPGAVYPSHVHDQAEECLMLEGELDFGDYVLKMGDYLRLEPGTKHGEARTEHGCLCLVTAELPETLVA